METFDDLQRNYLSQIVDLVKDLWIENEGMKQQLQKFAPPDWEKALEIWNNHPQNRDAATRKFYPLAAVIQQAKLDSVKKEELSEALEQISQAQKQRWS
jgi:hypothetical protein